MAELLRIFHVDSTAELLWIGIGLCGQILFAGRFIVQWIASEKERKSHIPLAFWYFSLAGGIVLTLYAIYRRDPVFLLGQGLGLLIYVRNLWLIRNERRTD